MPRASTDVLVVGAGPTGLTLACELARRGLAVRVVDQALEPAPESRALGVHARTLELLDQGLCVADRLVARGLPMRAVAVHARGRRIARARFDELDSPFPFVLSLPQSETERVLGERLRELGGDVERGLRFTGLATRADGVAATLVARDGGREDAAAAWLVGCDGAHSAVRGALGLPFEGARYEEPFVLGDVRIRGELPRDEARVFLSPAGVLALFPLPGEGGAWRVIAEAGGLDLARPLDLAALQALVDARAAGALALSEPGWLASFTVHRRQVPSYRAGRVLLAGDAAHLHSPIGGQGMNLGIQDAVNLAWKLALVHARGAPDGRLDSYQAERHPVGAATLRRTDLATRLATLHSPAGRELRDGLARAVAALRPLRRVALRGLAELDVAYRRSPIVGEHRAPLLSARFAPEPASILGWLELATAPGPGERVPDARLAEPSGGRTRLFELLRGTEHTLLLLAGAAPNAARLLDLARIGRAVGARFGDRVVAHLVTPRPPPDALSWSGSLVLDPGGAVQARLGASAACLYLVRPDGYVGFRSQPPRLEPLEAHLARVLGG
jgi:2-polyprenyl-6-methoxyphenol hydroxylase-like FAD-dependent oxidoreductase